jgi:predicted RNA-binding Zn-ribbon protein involved in translation (DUF1610 family)
MKRELRPDEAMRKLLRDRMKINKCPNCGKLMSKNNRIFTCYACGLSVEMDGK